MSRNQCGMWSHPLRHRARVWQKDESGQWWNANYARWVDQMNAGTEAKYGPDARRETPSAFDERRLAVALLSECRAINPLQLYRWGDREQIILYPMEEGEVIEDDD